MEYRTTYGVYRNPLSPFTYDNGPPISRLPSPAADMQQNMLVEQSQRPFHTMAINSILENSNASIVADREETPVPEMPEAYRRIAENARDSEPRPMGMTRAISSDQVNLSGRLTPPSRIASSLPNPVEAQQEGPLLATGFNGAPDWPLAHPSIAFPIPMRDFGQGIFSHHAPGLVMRNLFDPEVLAAANAEALEVRNILDPQVLADSYAGRSYAGAYRQCACKRISPSMRGYSLHCQSSEPTIFSQLSADGSTNRTVISTHTTSGPHEPTCHRYYRERDELNVRADRTQVLDHDAQIAAVRAQIIEDRARARARDVERRAQVVETRAERTNSDPGPRFAHTVLHGI